MTAENVDQKDGWGGALQAEVRGPARNHCRQSRGLRKLWKMRLERWAGVCVEAAASCWKI